MNYGEEFKMEVNRLVKSGLSIRDTADHLSVSEEAVSSVVKQGLLDGQQIREIGIVPALDDQLIQ